MDNKLWLTEEQIEVIVSILKKQCERIEERNQKLSDDFPDLFDELYYTGRGHGDTGAVYAGFTEATEIPDMKVYRVKYGRGYCNRFQVLCIYQSHHLSRSIREMANRDFLKTAS